MVLELGNWEARDVCKVDEFNSVIHLSSQRHQLEKSLRRDFSSENFVQTGERKGKRLTFEAT